jgi:hypothetical protein
MTHPLHDLLAEHVHEDVHVTLNGGTTLDGYLEQVTDTTITLKILTNGYVPVGEPWKVRQTWAVHTILLDALAGAAITERVDVREGDLEEALRNDPEGRIIDRAFHLKTAAKNTATFVDDDDKYLHEAWVALDAEWANDKSIPGPPPFTRP